VAPVEPGESAPEPGPRLPRELESADLIAAEVAPLPSGLMLFEFAPMVCSNFCCLYSLC
jgi:hypothetical protein